MGLTNMDKLMSKRERDGESECAREKESKRMTDRGDS